MNNREIKFRAWDAENFEGPTMHYFDVMQVCDNGLFFANSKFDLGKWHNDSDEPPIMQFTGLRDKNGIEIYEGDILRDGKTMCVVEWHERSGCWIKRVSVEAYWNFHVESEMEVIGNIHQQRQ